MADSCGHVHPLVTSSLAAYAFAKIPFPERNTMFLVYIMTMAVPFQVIMIPQFILMKNLGLSDSLWALVVLQSFSPFGVFLLRQFFMTIPDELCECARIDGLSEFGIYSRIILPLAKPALSTLAIFQFKFVWNDFLGPLIYLTSDKNKTIQLGIRKFYTQYGVEYGLIMAASVCALIPVILVYAAFQKYFIQGIATTGLRVAHKAPTPRLTALCSGRPSLLAGLTTCLHVASLTMEVGVKIKSLYSQDSDRVRFKRILELTAKLC